MTTQGALSCAAPKFAPVSVMVCPPAVFIVVTFTFVSVGAMYSGLEPTTEKFALGWPLTVTVQTVPPPVPTATPEQMATLMHCVVLAGVVCVANVPEPNLQKLLTFPPTDAAYVPFTTQLAAA